jgi:hypothetical protein
VKERGQDRVHGTSGGLLAKDKGRHGHHRPATTERARGPPSGVAKGKWSL